MNRKILILIASFFIIFFAIFIRANSLSLRVLHADESEQAWTFSKLLDNNSYKFNPQDHHGPTLYYGAYFLAKMLGIENSQNIEITFLRSVSVIGFLFLLIVVLFFKRKSSLSIFWISLIATSPALFLYAGYFVQEIWLVGFTYGLLFSLIKFLDTKKLIYALFAGILAGLCQSTKETSIISFFSIFVALFFCNNNFHAKEDCKVLYKSFAIFCLTFIAIFVAFYSSFFTYFAGIKDGVITYFSYFEKSQNSVHNKEFLYFIKIFTFFKIEGLKWGEYIFGSFALIGTILIFKQKGKTYEKAICVFALCSLFIYSFIKYKTIWLILTPLPAICFLSAYPFFYIIKNSKNKKYGKIFSALSLICFAYLIYTQINITKKANFRFSNDNRNPYTYVHTSKDILRLVKKIDQIKAQNPTSLICINLNVSPWPLPWYLKSYKNIAYNNPSNSANFIITNSPEKYDEEKVYGDIYGLREGTLLYIIQNNKIANSKEE